VERIALRPAEVGETLGIGRSKVYELIQRRELPSVRIGGSIRVPLEALQAWIDRQLAETV
jgi:excisionase family DNA binding protein